MAETGQPTAQCAMWVGNIPTTWPEEEVALTEVAVTGLARTRTGFAVGA